MQVIPQVISTIGSPMSIKNPKIRHLLPFSAVFRLGNVKNDSYPVLIIIPNRALISRRCICLDISIGLDTVFGGLEVGDGQHHLGQRRVGVFNDLGIAGTQVFCFGVQVHFLSHDLVGLANGGLGLRSGLVLVRVPLVCLGLLLNYTINVPRFACLRRCSTFWGRW